MFVYSNNYEEMKNDLLKEINKLKQKGYHIFSKKHEVVDDLFIDKITIKAKSDLKNRLVLCTGLHGIEGYVGHSALKTFFNEILELLDDSTEVVIYHVLNPYGMKNLRRTNENNVDLNRNFSKNSFQSKNKEFENVKHFFEPKSYSTSRTAKLNFYSSLTKMITKHGTETLKRATLLGQKVQSNGLYFSGTEFQESTKYFLTELDNIYLDAVNVVLVDIHTGYGPRYQMSIVNSKFEKDSTLDMIEKMDYPLILGVGTSDFYDIDGDMIERAYEIHKDEKATCNLYATCFEFGTLGDSTLKTIESLKAMLFENSSFFKAQKPKFNDYAVKLIKEQFLPSASKWREKAELDFKKALTEIIKYKNI